MQVTKFLLVTLTLTFLVLDFLHNRGYFTNYSHKGKSCRLHEISLHFNSCEFTVRSGEHLWETVPLSQTLQCHVLPVAHRSLRPGPTEARKGWFGFLRQAFSVHPWLSWNSLCGQTGWLQTQRPSCLPLSAEIRGSANIPGYFTFVPKTFLS